MDPLVFRGIERLLIVGCGALLIYLGYRLFLHLPDKVDASGKVILPGQISVYMSRVGPGIFFALFGAVLLGLLVRALVTTPDGAGGGVTYLGSPRHTNQIAAAPGAEQLAEALRGIILDLNSDVAPLLASNAPTAEMKQTARNTLMDSKLKLMKVMWDEKRWGSYDEFRNWVLGGVGSASPKMLEPAAIFRSSSHNVP